nr:MAG TPA: hypothetical protein [Caudoviricetes sp.]
MSCRNNSKRCSPVLSGPDFLRPFHLTMLSIRYIQLNVKALFLILLSSFLEEPHGYIFHAFPN